MSSKCPAGWVEPAILGKAAISELVLWTMFIELTITCRLFGPAVRFFE
jgi:hypothetical protein